MYKTLFDNTREGFVLTDKKGIIQLVNPRFVEMFRYGHQDEVIGEPIEIVIPREYHKQHVGNREGFAKNPKSRDMGIGMYLYGQRNDGTKIPVEVSLSHFKNEDGELQILALVSDASIRKEAEDTIKQLNSELEKKVQKRTRELRRSYELYSEIARNFPNGTINVFDQNMNYVFVDGKELFKMGIDGKMLIGSNYITRLPKDIAPKIKDELLAVFQGKHRSFEIQVASNDYELNAVPLVEDSGEINQILVVERNITEEKKIKEEIKLALEKEKELNELKSRFVSMASHEFRTPLSSIFSSATLLAKYTETEQQPRRDKHISRIKNSVISLTGILNDILSLSKVEEGKIEVQAEEFVVATFCGEICEEIQSIAARGQVITHSHQGETMFNTDIKLLKNIVFNLLSNAIKYSYDKGEIILTATVTKAMLKVEVKDFGIGIPLSDQKRMFERFFRAENVVNIEGTGLGLNIVKKYIELLEGNITFKSVPEKETTFTIEIPHHY